MWEFFITNALIIYLILYVVDWNKKCSSIACRSHTKKLFSDSEVQSSFQTPQYSTEHKDQDAANGVESSTTDYELATTTIYDNSGGNNSDYAVLNTEPEYSNTDHVYSDMI